MGWHNLTKVIPVLTPEICFPWGITLEQIYYGVGENQKQLGRWAIPVSTDDLLPLGSGGTPVNLATYVVRTPHDLWKLRDDVTAGTQNTVVSCGSVGQRSKFFISTKLNELEALTLQDGTKTELLLNSLGSVDKSRPEQHSISSIRGVCQNTMDMSFFNDAIKFRYSHHINMNDRIAKDKPLIEAVAGLSAVIKAAFNDLITKPCNTARAERIYTGLIVSPEQEEISKRAENMIQQHVDCFSRGAGNSGKSEYDVLNGFSELRTKGYDGSKKSRFDTFETSEFGNYGASKSRLARMLISDRDELNKVEERGRKLMSVGPVVVPV
jgi:hypothetical protein